MTDPVPAPPAATPRRGAPPVLTPQILKRAILVLLALALLVLLVKGANQPQDPYLRSGGRQPVQGFGQISFRVDPMPAAERCALLAETDAQRARGLMGRTDLAGYDGMLFVFDGDTRTSFFMQNTPLPLSIAWFDSSGRFVSSADMDPCLGRTDCPLYSARGRYRYALEVPQGGLAALGVGPGSTISVGGPCR